MCYNSGVPKANQMKKIVFFDIDRTLFDSSRFLTHFFEELSKNFKIGETSEDFKRIYEETKNEAGYFVPETCIRKISETFPSIPKENLERIFWNGSLFEKCLYPDALSINFLKNAEIGIFSKGDYAFQMKKLDFIKDILDRHNIYIFPNKLEHINELISSYKDYEVYFVDNDIDVLKAVQKNSSKALLILIDRSEELEDNVGVIKIKNLEELQNII